MTTSPIHRLPLSRVLEALFIATGSDARTDAGALARDLGVSATRVAQALLALDERGLVDAARARLTLPGLAVAAALAAGESPARLGLRDRAA